MLQGLPSHQTEAMPTWLWVVSIFTFKPFQDRSFLRCVSHGLLIWHASSVEHSLSTGKVMFACQQGRVAVEHWLAVLIVSLIAADEFEEARLLKTTSRLLGSGGFGHGRLCCVGIGWHGECDWS